MQRLHSPEQAAQWLRLNVLGNLLTDHRLVHANDGFIAWPGAVHDARRFIPEALERGASACIVEEEGLDTFDWTHTAAHNGRVASYAGLKSACGSIAASFYAHPSASLNMVAITGTNGKTSSAWWLAHALEKLGQRAAFVGTLGMGRLGHLTATGMTTPDPVLLQSHLRVMVEEGVQACVMEASSIGMAEHRLDGTQLRVALFTNFTQDHLDYHGDMARYWSAKEALFEWPGLQHAVINLDDPQGAVLANKLKVAGDVTVWTFSSTNVQEPVVAAHSGQSQHVQASQVDFNAQGMHFQVAHGGHKARINSHLVGDYNVSNLTGVMTCLCAMGYPFTEVIRVCESLPSVPGRMELLGQSDQPLVVIDYAHTPDAVEKALQGLTPLAKRRGGALVCVIGCGGDRDSSKRSQMASAAERFSQHVVLTSDNPRSEDPQSILSEMARGLQAPQSAHIEVDRATAIAMAVQQAQAADVVLIAGKGHETFQEILGVKYPFSDQWHAQQALNHRSLHV